MIKFVYNYKEMRFGDLRDGTFFMMDKEEYLYLKVENVEMHSILTPQSERKPMYNAYSFDAKMFKHIDLNKVVTPVNVYMTVTPQT